MNICIQAILLANRLPWSLPALILAASLSAPAAEPTASVPIMLRPDPLHAAWLPVPDATKTLMRSGFDYNDGNYDSGNLMRVEPAGSSYSNAASSWVLFEAEGPGVVTSIWFTGKNKQGQAYLGGRLGFVFDGAQEAAIAGDLPAFLEGSGTFPHPLAEKSSGGWVSYAPVYFARNLKVTLSQHEDRYAHRRNGRGEPIPHIYHQFTWQRLPSPVRSSLASDFAGMRPWQRDERGVRTIRNLSLPAGQPTAVFSAEGKGILNALRLRFSGVDVEQISLRISADGRPRIELGMPEFWGGVARLRPQAQFRALLLGADDANGYYSFFPMPHRSEFRVELTNRGRAGSVRVETVHRGAWSEPELFHFFAARVTDVTERDRDLRLLEAKGRGHFVGAVLELADRTLEGDDRFYVDDEPFPPSWHGTGTEDYFRCGWYFHGGAITRPLYGLIDNQRPKVAYRFHVADRVNFTQSLAIGFEHGHRNEYMGPYRGVVFWYGAD